jgi:hypothetical protein
MSLDIYSQPPSCCRGARWGRYPKTVRFLSRGSCQNGINETCRVSCQFHAKPSDLRNRKSPRFLAHRLRNTGRWDVKDRDRFIAAESRCPELRGCGRSLFFISHPSGEIVCLPPSSHCRLAKDCHTFNFFFSSFSIRS